MTSGQGDSPHQTFKTRSRAVLGDLLAGVSQADAAVNNGVSERTVKRWLAKGRMDPDGPYGEFAELVDRAHIDRELPPDDERPIDQEELLLLVSRLGRKGNVRALALARDILAERSPWEEDDPFAKFDPPNWSPRGSTQRR